MRVLVTGASQGIGRATALRLAGPKAELALHYFQHPKEAGAVAEEVRARGGGAFLVGTDLARPEGAEQLADAIRSRWDSVDALVLNAGAYPRVRFREITDDAFVSCLRLNVIAPAELIQGLLPLLERSSAGRVVFVSSVLAFTGSAHGAHYAAAKAAQLGLARSLARELAPRTTVNVVAPGSIDTAILAGDSPAQRTQREQQIPAGRIGSPEEVAETIAFLVSPSASYITGSTVHVNGGLYPD